MNLFFSILFVCSIWYEVNSVYYDTWTGRTLSKQQIQRYKQLNSTFWCTINVAPCDPHEWRRIDGSCNNLNFPPRGAAHTPVRRILDAHFGKDFDVRTSKDGESLVLPRVARTSILPAGKVPGLRFTQLVSYMSSFMFSDVTSIHDTLNYILWKTNCCAPPEERDPECVPNIIPNDDPVRRFSDVKCMNLTRPFTFQSKGCAPNYTVPNRIISATTSIDLSMLYGASIEKLQEFRQLEGGLLKEEIENDRIWPPSFKDQNKIDEICRANQKPHETRCHDLPEEGSNSVFSQNLFLIWSWRHHNRIAKRLAVINPCWDDERLFNTARDINIAIITQIYYYEFWPALLGYENLVLTEVISSHLGYRDVYDETLLPQNSIEFLTAMRWFHTLQNGMIKFVDENGHYLKQYPIVNLTLKTGYLTVDKAIDYITLGASRQMLPKSNHLIDPDVSEIGLGPHQKAADITTSDLAKNRLYGLAPYIKYLKACFRDTIKDFDDLKKFMDEERIEILKELYKNVEDIDLLAGIWSERNIRRSHVPYTFFCLIVDNLNRNVVTDRHWYERQNRPHAFTLPQLLEIRKASIARFLCDVGDKVTNIQPHAFIRPQEDNKICSCDEINEIDYYTWADNSCQLDVE